MIYKKQDIVAGLYDRATMILEGLSDNPYGLFAPPKEFDENLIKLMSTWRVEKGPNWDYNMRSDVIKDGDSFLPWVNLPYLKMAQAAYFLSEDEAAEVLDELYEESVPVIVIDTTDSDETDTDHFIAALRHAQLEGSTVELQLDDDSTVDLDDTTIDRLLNDMDLVKKLLDNLGSFYDVASVLDLDVDETEPDDFEGDGDES